VSDCNEKIMDKLTNNVFGKLFGDKGYLSKKIFKILWNKGIKMVTKIRKNMRNILMEMEDKLLLKKRGTIESVIGILKKFFSVESTRHRSSSSFLNNLCSGLIAYAFKTENLQYVLIKDYYWIKQLSNSRWFKKKTVFFATKNCFKKLKKVPT